MEMNSKPYSLDKIAALPSSGEKVKFTSPAELAEQIAAHEAFLKTPEGKEWELMNRQIVDYETGLHRPDPNPEQTKSFVEKIREMTAGMDIDVKIPTGFRRLQDMVSSDGFKPGELLDVFIGLPPNPYPKTNFMLHMVLKKMRDDPTFKPVFHFTNELDMEFFDETRFQTALKNMGIESTNPSDHKETK